MTEYELLKINIERCRKCPMREPGCGITCFTRMEIDRRVKKQKEIIEDNRNADVEYKERKRLTHNQYVERKFRKRRR